MVGNVLSLTIEWFKKVFGTARELRNVFLSFFLTDEGRWIVLSVFCIPARIHGIKFLLIVY